MEKFRFCYQENQFYGECLPCTPTVLNRIINSAEVDRRITTRQGVEQAIDEDLDKEPFLRDNDFHQFCTRQTAKQGEDFAALHIDKKLQQWANSLKMLLPCFIFGVEGFQAVPKTDKDGNPIFDKDGNPVLFRRRLQQNILALSGLFMYDGDHLPIDPREVYERTRRESFPWVVRLAHKTSSGHGIRLVCEARTDVGNIADNQIELARELGLLGMIGTTGKPVVDDSCIDASRISYAPRKKDIYFIDEDHLFNFNNL